MQSIVRKAVRPFMVVLKGIILSLIICATGGAWAAGFKMTNPVTGEEETYTWKFTGTDAWNSTNVWENSDGNHPSGVPAKTGSSRWEPLLVDGSKTINTMSSWTIEGWNLRMGFYNGANVSFGKLNKLQGDTTMWITVDKTSHFAVAAYEDGNFSDNKTLKFSVASANGITWRDTFACNNTDNNTIEYYLKGAGSVSFQALNAGTHRIKMADVTLTGTSQVSSKTLVSFTSTTKTFTADADIKVYGIDGETLKKTVKLVTVRRAGVAIENATSTLTTDDSVGSCEIVQCTDGIVLYYVDGAPDTIAAYKPSININFTDGAANGLTTISDVGLEGYAVPGTAWNNFVVANNTTYSTVNAVDSTGAASVASGVSVTVSGTRGSYSCSNLTPASNPLHGYIDESADQATPTVTITGIPYDHYRVIVYHSTDTENAQFGYDTINGFDFTYVDGEQQTGTTSWGSAGAANSAEAIAEGVNTLVSAVLSGDTVTMVAHRIGGGSPSARGCFAAIQVVEYVPEVGENDLEIAVDGATEYEVTESKTLSGTVYLTGSGTLTLTGSEKITAATIDVGSDVVLNINADRLDATTFTGSGTVVYDNTPPVTGKGWAAIGWSGTVWIKNKSGITGNDAAGTGVQPNNLGNANSKVKFSGVSGWLEAPITYTPEIVLENDAYDYALKLTDGNSPQSSGANVNRCTIIKKLSGSGKVTCGEATSSWPVLKVYDASAYTGDIDCGSSGTCLVVVFAAENETLPDTLYALFNSAPRSIYISANGSATVASGATWTAKNGITVNGTLYANGALASSAETAAIKGSGTVVFTGRLPTPVDGSNETKWWKNANWTGTVQIDSLTGFIGSGNGTVLAPNDYGNTGSTLELKNCSGWLPVNYECTVPLSVAGTLTIGNGYSGVGNAFTIDHLKGSGQITCNGSAPTVLIYVREWSGYTGKVKMDNKMIVFGADTITASDLASGTIYICEGAVVTNRNTYHWEPYAKMKVNGTFAVTSRAGWTDSKPLELGANGVVNFIGSGVDDHNYNFSNITGSGKILFTNGTGYSMLPSDASKMPSTDVAVVNDNTASYVVLTCTGTTTIGTLSGSGKFDSRYGNATTRRLAVVQGADSEWSGTFVNEDRVGGMDVSAKSGAAAKTLTLSGKQTASNELVVKAATETTDAGSVNLTGTWVGATTVSGTFGGTGTLTGNLTFNTGSTFKAFASDENGLSVSGTVTTPGSGTVTVDVSAISESITASGVTLISGGVSEGGTFAVDSAYRLDVDGSALKVYPAVTYVAEYDGVQYETVQAAIDAAVADGHTYADVTILDATAECPDGYYVDKEDNDALKMCQAAIVKTDSSKVYFKTAQLAFDDISATTNLVTYMQGYTCVEVYSGKGTEILINASAAIWNYGQAVKIRCLNGSTVSVSTTATESTLTAGTADENDIVTYTSTPVATTYVWAGTAGTAANWSSPAKWKVGSAEGATASRAPGSTDTVVFSNGASVSGVSGISVAALQVSGTVTFTGGGSLTSASAITLGADDSIVITGTLLTVPTTNVSHSRVKAVTVGSTTTYRVEEIPGTIFSVY